MEEISQPTFSDNFLDRVSDDSHPFISPAHLKTRTAAELIVQLRELEIRMRTYSDRGLTNLKLLELMIYSDISREADAVREELDSRYTTATI